MIATITAFYGRRMKLLALLGIIAATGTPQIRVSTPVTSLGHAIPISVSGVAAASVEARAVGATRRLGKDLPWTGLTYDGHAWVGLLPAPELRGIYALDLRIDHRPAAVGSLHWSVRVFAHGTLSRPTFASPEGVARDWVRRLPSGPRLVAWKRWPLPAFDHRDPRLHRLVVVAYQVPGGPRLGMFVTAVRSNPHGRWRLLDASVYP